MAADSTFSGGLEQSYISEYAAQAGMIRSPAVDISTMQPGQRSVPTQAVAAQIIVKLVQDNRQRNLLNARIMSRYDAEKPWRDEILEQEGLSWKANFSTKPLPTLIDKVAPRFADALDKTRFLTSSALPDYIPGSAEKTRRFREEITKLIRGRRGWKNLIDELAQENALFGFCGVACLNEYDWFPKAFRQDEFFIPIGTKQNAEYCQLCVLKETILPHDLFEQIKDHQSAHEAGYNVPNAVKAVNEASPQTIRSKYADWARVYEDLQRQLSLFGSFMQGASVIELWHVLATEVTGKVSHSTYATNAFYPIFGRADRFESMTDAVAFFSFQQANGTMHGSKGIGREVYAMANVLDRARNEIVDRLQLAGKLVLSGDQKHFRKFRMNVFGNAILISKEFEVSSQRIDGAVDPYIAMDSWLTGLLDQMAGSTTPKVFQGERVTKAAVDFYAARDDEKADSVIGRFLTQISDLVSMMQRRICKEQVDEPGAKEVQKRLLSIMSREELDLLANTPTIRTVADYTEMERQKIVVIASEARANPLYNQKKLEREKISALLSSDFADTVLLPDDDPTEMAEQARTQQMENFILVQGQPVPVSPRDNHRIHLDVMLPAVTSTVHTAMDQPAALGILKELVMHGEQHIAYALQQGADKQTFAEDIQVVEQAKQALMKIAALEAQQQSGQEPNPQTADAFGAPPPASPMNPGTPPTTTPPAQTP
jgi:hypothetical protein